MPNVLSAARPTFVYSCVPTTAEQHDGAVDFFFDQNVLKYHSNGGYTCQHEIWLYPTDYMFVQPVPWQRGTLFRVLRRPFRRNRMLYVFVPLRTFNCLASWLFRPYLERQPLRRLNVYHPSPAGGWTWYEYMHSGDGESGAHTTTLARNGGKSNSIIMDTSHFHALLDYAKSDKANHIPESVVYHVAASGGERLLLAATIQDFARDHALYGYRPDVIDLG